MYNKKCMVINKKNIHIINLYMKMTKYIKICLNGMA